LTLCDDVGPSLLDRHSRHGGDARNPSGNEIYDARRDVLKSAIFPKSGIVAGLKSKFCCDGVRDRHGRHGSDASTMKSNGDGDGSKKTLSTFLKALNESGAQSSTRFKAFLEFQQSIFKYQYITVTTISETKFSKIFTQDLQKEAQSLAQKCLTSLIY
jgi:hypothetical protein